jgi:cell division protein FtsN
MYHVIKYQEQAFTDTSKYLPERSDDNPEDEPYYLEKDDPVPDDAYDGRGIPKQYPQDDRVATADNDEVTTIDLSSGIEEDKPVKPVKKPVAKPVEKPKPAPKPVEPKKDPPSTIQAVKPVDPCAVWDTRKGWIIQDNSFSNKETADLRVKALQQRGLKAEVVAKKCFTPGASGFIVRLDAIFNKETEARIRAAEILEALERYNLDQGSPMVKGINL